MAKSVPWVLLLSLALSVGVALSASFAAPADHSALPPVGDVNIWRPFEPYPAGPGSIPYSELQDNAIEHSPGAYDDNPAIEPHLRRDLYTDTKASVADVVEWADAWNGQAVHDAWAAYTLIAQEQARIVAAERTAGLTVIGEVGVP